MQCRKLPVRSRPESDQTGLKVTKGPLWLSTAPYRRSRKLPPVNGPDAERIKRRLDGGTSQRQGASVLLGVTDTAGEAKPQSSGCGCSGCWLGATTAFTRNREGG